MDFKILHTHAQSWKNNPASHDSYYSTFSVSIYHTGGIYKQGGAAKETKWCVNNLITGDILNISHCD